MNPEQFNEWVAQMHADRAVALEASIAVIKAETAAILAIPGNTKAGRAARKDLGRGFKVSIYKAP